MDLIEKIARIYAKHEGFDPDSVHFEHKLKKFKDSIVGDNVERLELVDTGKKKWELYTDRAEAALEIYKILIKEVL